MKLVIFSPNQNPYSETFIQAHKNHINAEKTFYIYGNSLENMIIEHEGFLINSKQRLFYKGISKLLKRDKQYYFVKAVVKKLKTLKIDVALVEYGNHASKLIEVFKIAGIPFVVHFHGYDISVRKIIKQNSNYKSIFEAATFVIGVSKLMCRNLQDLECPKNKIVYTAYGANPTFLNIRPAFENKQALSIGRFVDKKAPYYTILAFKKVIEVFPKARLIMVGDGVLFNTCSNLVKYYKLTDNIQLVGIKTPDEIIDIMQESYCFVQHSVTADNGNQEGTPVAIMEAALAGLPVVSSIHAGIPDVIEHGSTGLLSNEHDVDTMAQHIIKLFKDKEYAISLGNNAKRIHSKYYPLEKHIQIIEDTLQNAIANKNSSSLV
jgi:glycosyltransferase involved in cell wall biosynthesis